MSNLSLFLNSAPTYFCHSDADDENAHHFCEFFDESLQNTLLVLQTNGEWRARHFATTRRLVVDKKVVESRLWHFLNLLSVSSTLIGPFPKTIFTRWLTSQLSDFHLHYFLIVMFLSSLSLVMVFGMTENFNVIVFIVRSGQSLQMFWL